MEQDTGVLVAPGAMDDPAFEHRLEMIMTSAGKIIAQDMHVDALVQVGLRSRFAIARPLFLAGGRAGPVQPLAAAPLPPGLGRHEGGQSAAPPRRAAPADRPVATARSVAEFGAHGRQIGRLSSSRPEHRYGRSRRGRSRGGRFGAVRAWQFSTASYRAP